MNLSQFGSPRVLAGFRRHACSFWAVIIVMAQASVLLRGYSPVLMLDTGGHMGLVSGVAFTPDGKYLVSTGYDKVIRVWDWQAGQVVRVLRGQVGAGDEGRINAVALSPDGRRLAAGGQMALRGQSAQPIRIYDFETGELIQLLTGHTGKIIALAFSPDGMRLLSGSGDRTAVLWDVTTGRLLHRLDRHKAEVYGVGFTPDGARVVTGSFDRMIRLWRSADGRLIAELNALKEIMRWRCPAKTAQSLLAASTGRSDFGTAGQDAI